MSEAIVKRCTSHNQKLTTYVFALKSTRPISLLFHGDSRCPLVAKMPCQAIKREKSAANKELKGHKEQLMKMTGPVPLPWHMCMLLAKATVSTLLSLYLT